MKIPFCSPSSVRAASWRFCGGSFPQVARALCSLCHHLTFLSCHQSPERKGAQGRLFLPDLREKVSLAAPRRAFHIRVDFLSDSEKTGRLQGALPGLWGSLGTPRQLHTTGGEGALEAPSLQVEGSLCAWNTVL